MKPKNDKTAELLTVLASGELPEAVPPGCAYEPELSGLLDYLNRIQRATLAMARGDLALGLDGERGALAEGLRLLQASLRRVVRQTEQAAAGDFSQRVDFMGEVSSAFNSVVGQLKEAREELIHVGNHDALTGLYNRGFFDAEFERMSKGRAFPISFVVAELNGVKLANERRGNAVGDDLIARGGALLRSQLRGDDILARVGGDEFVAILPGADAGAAEMVVARIRRAVEKANDGGDQIPVSLSLGCGTAPTAQRMADAYKEADDRMTIDKVAHYLK